MNIGLGYAGQNITLQGESDICKIKEPVNYTARINRTCMLNENFPEKIIPEAIKLGRENLKDLLLLLKWNEEHDIRFFRINSEILPHISNWRLIPEGAGRLDYKQLAYDIKIFLPELHAVGDYINKHKHRITFHPGFFTVINTPKHFLLISSMRELWWHTLFIEYAGLSGGPSTLTIHIGGIYDDKERAMRRFIDNFKQLPPETQKLLIIENDETQYCVEDLFKISTWAKKELGTYIPICFDYFHYCCYNKQYKGAQKPVEALIPLIIKTWEGRRPKCHLSEQALNKQMGTHSNYIKKIPKILLGLEIDIMLESKCAELTLLDLRKKLN